MENPKYCASNGKAGVILSGLSVITAGGVLGAALTPTLERLPSLYQVALMAALCVFPLLVSLALQSPVAALGFAIFLIPITSRLKDQVYLDFGWLWLSVDGLMILALFVLLLPRLLPVRVPVPALFQGWLMVVGLGLAAAYRDSAALALVFEGLCLPLLWFVIVMQTTRNSTSTGLHAEGIVVGLTAATFVTTAYAIVQFVRLPERPGSVYYNPNIMAEVMVIVLPFFLALTAAERPRLRLMGWTGLFASSAAILLSESRGAMVAAALAVLAVVVIIPRLKRVVTVGLVAVAAAATNKYLRTMIIARRLYLQAGFRGGSFWERAAAVRGSVNMILFRPLGFGPGGFARNYPDFRPLGAITNLDSAHNLFLNTAVEFGIAGGVLLLALYLSALGDGFRFGRAAETRGDKRLLIVGAWAGVLGHALVGALTGTTFSHRHIFAGQFFLWTMLALIYALGEPTGERVKP